MYSPAKVGSNPYLHIYMVLVIGKKVVARVLPEQASLLRNHVMYKHWQSPRPSVRWIYARSAMPFAAWCAMKITDPQVSKMKGGLGVEKECWSISIQPYFYTWDVPPTGGTVAKVLLQKVVIIFGDWHAGWDSGTPTNTNNHVVVHQYWKYDRASLHFESSSDGFRMDSGITHWKKRHRFTISLYQKVDLWLLSCKKQGAFTKTSHQTPDSVHPSWMNTVGNYPETSRRTWCGWWWTYQFLGPCFWFWCL